MVGKRTWPMAEIVWILRKWRAHCKVQELVDQYVGEFPDSTRSQNLKTLRTGIQYVWDKYSKDPSYNHDFSGDEIWFIMVKSRGMKGSVTKEFLKLFKEAFPDHDWKVYVDELLAIEAAIAKYQRESPYCVEWSKDEVHFVFLNRSHPEGWEGLFTAFQAWRNRGEVTLCSLQYLHASRHMDKCSDIDVLEYLESNMWPSHDDNSLSIVQNSTKRRREDDRSRDESQKKRVRSSPQRQSGANMRANRSSLAVDGMSESINHDRKMSNSSLLGPSHPQIPLGDLRTDPRVHPPGSGTTQYNHIGDGDRYSDQHLYAPNLYNFTPTIPVSQQDSSGYSTPDAPGLTYPFPNIIPQTTLYSGQNGQYGFKPVHTTPLGDEECLRSRRARTLSRGATSPPNTTPGWSPRDPWNRNSFQPIHYHRGSVTGLPGPVPYTNSQVEDPSMKDNLQQYEAMHQPLQVPPTPSDILMAEETETPFQNIGYPSGKLDFIGIRNLQEIMPQIPGDLLNIHSTGEKEPYNPDMGASSWDADLDPYENWQGFISAVTFDLSGMMDTSTAQQSYPDGHALAGQFESNLFDSLLAPTSAIPGDYLGMLRMEGNQIYPSSPTVHPAQQAFTLDGDWPGPASMVSSDPLCMLEMKVHQNILLPSIGARQTQGMYLPSANLQGGQQERITPENFSILPRTEDMHALEDSRALFGDVNSYADELKRTADATELGEFEKFIFSDHDDVTILGNFPASNSEAPNHPIGVVGMENHQTLKDDEEAFSGEIHLSSIEAVREPEKTDSFASPNLLDIEKVPVSSGDHEISPRQPAATEWQNVDMMLPRLRDIKDAQPATSFDLSTMLGSNEGEWTDPDLGYFSDMVNPMTKYGAPNVLTDTKVIEENETPPEEAVQYPMRENDGLDGTVHGDV